MKILAIDPGSYSIKFLEMSTDRKGLKLIEQTEIVIRTIKNQVPLDLPLHFTQLEVIKSFLATKKSDSKILIQMPSEMLTSRFLQLPINSRKKAELMIPFQLEEEIPHGPGNSHYAVSLRKKGQGFRATVHVAGLKFFDEYYKAMNERNIVPHFLTTELGLVENFQETWSILKQQNQTDLSVKEGYNSYALIDIGHETTKGYFVENNEVVSSHISRYAGKHITESLTSTYNISEEEAEDYKHQNSFFLTEMQYSEVEKEQAEFAKIMKQSIWPLIQEIRRWEIGHRVKYGRAIEVIYITGGSSRIKNIANFLTQNLKMKVVSLSNSGPMFAIDFPMDEDQRQIYWSCYIMGKAITLKLPISNLLQGPYSKNFSSGLPLHSIAFLSLRTAMIASIVVCALLIERAILTTERNQLYLQTSKILKSPQLAMPNKEIRNLKLKPELVLKEVKSKGLELDKEVKLVVGKSQVNGLRPLIFLSKNLGSNLNADLDKITFDGKHIKGQFSSNIKEELAMIKNKLEALGTMKLDAQVGKKGDRNTLAFDFQMIE